MTLLTGHTSPETAYVVDDYPYGFTFRCKIRYWIETNKHGQRVVSQTTNPKRPGTVWNNAKASTYTALRVLFLDDKGHVQNAGLHIYASLEAIADFEHTYGAALTEPWQQKTLGVIKKLAQPRRALAPEGAV